MTTELGFAGKIVVKPKFLLSRNSRRAVRLHFHCQDSAITTLQNQNPLISSESIDDLASRQDSGGPSKKPLPVSPYILAREPSDGNKPKRSDEIPPLPRRRVAIRNDAIGQSSTRIRGGARVRRTDSVVAANASADAVPRLLASDAAARCRSPIGVPRSMAAQYDRGRRGR